MTATAMLESNASAAPPDLAPPETSDPRVYFQQHVVQMLAGLTAERRARQGSTPGWVRWRTRDELTAYHEAGHATAAWVPTSAYAASAQGAQPGPMQLLETSAVECL